MENLEKISLFSVLLALILALFVSNAVHAVGVTDTITVGGLPNGVAYDSGKGEIFVANYNFNSVWIISTVPLGDEPTSLTYDSGRNEIFVSTEAFTPNVPGVSVIADSSNTVVATVPLSAPCYVAYDSGKSEIFVANADNDTVSIISDSNNSVVATVTTISGVINEAYDSKKGEMFVGNEAFYGTVSVISDSTNTVVANVIARKKSWLLGI